MTAFDEPVIDVAALMATLREEVRRKQGVCRSRGEDGGAESWNPIHASLDMAEQRAMIGSGVPNMNRFHWLLRLPARLVARVLLYLLQIVTLHQREYNQSMVKAVRGLVRRLRAAQEGHASLAEQIEQLRQRCGDRDAQIELLQSRLAALTLRLDVLAARGGDPAADASLRDAA
jgi:hypothetical protein